MLLIVSTNGPFGVRWEHGGELMVLVASDLATERPDQVALRDDAVTLGWGQVNDTLNRVVNGLGELDLGPDRRVAVLAENSAETVLAHLGGLLAGASTVPVNFHLNVDEVTYILEDSGARVLFVGPETAATGTEAARRAGVPVVIGWRTGDQPGVTSWEAWLAAASPAEPSTDVEPRPNLMYTSGTTGRPKGVELPPTMFAGGGTMVEHVAALAQSAFAAFGTHLVVGPMYHTGPLSGVRLLAAGVPVVVLGRFDAEGVLQAIDTHRAESTVMVPTHFIRLLALPEDVRSRYDVSSLRLVAHTGASCPIDVKRRMIEWFGPVLQDSYGATEVGTTCTISSAEWLEHPGSVGRAVPPFRAIVIDDDDQEVPPGTEGRLYFEDATGRGIIYPGDPEKSAQAHLRPGVFTLGEIGYITDDGFVYITDRFTDMIVSGGVNIYPAESEQVLGDHPDVADVAVIGVPNRDMGEEVKALVVPADPARPPSSEELIALVPGATGRLQVPALGGHRRDGRPHGDGQGEQARVAQAVLGDRRHGPPADMSRRLLSLAAGTVLDVDPPGPSTSPPAVASTLSGSGSTRSHGRRRRPPPSPQRLQASGITPLDMEPVILGRDVTRGTPSSTPRPSSACGTCSWPADLPSGPAVVDRARRTVPAGRGTGVDPRAGVPADLHDRDARRCRCRSSRRSVTRRRPCSSTRCTWRARAARPPTWRPWRPAASLPAARRCARRTTGRRPGRAA